MKKSSVLYFLASMVLCLLVLLPGQCLAGPVQRVASVPYSELNIGGIIPSSTLQYVEQVYGTPTKVSTEPYRNGYYYKIYDYGNGLFGAIAITKGTGSNNYVWGVYCKESNLATPSGFRVGMPFSKVAAKYSAPQPVKNRRDSRLLDYEYFIYHGMGSMIFTVDQKGLITRISFFTGE
jgi:hypothetical protein